MHTLFFLKHVNFLFKMTLEAYYSVGTFIKLSDIKLKYTVSLSSPPIHAYNAVSNTISKSLTMSNSVSFLSQTHFSFFQVSNLWVVLEQWF